MTTAAFSLLTHAANNREKWLSRFYKIGKEAVQPRKGGELYGFRLKIGPGTPTLLKILERAGVQYGFPNGEKSETVKVSLYESEVTYPSQAILIPLEQAYGGFAKAMLEKQSYPNLRDEKGNPIPPYDVTAHTLQLLLGNRVEPIYAPFKPLWEKKAHITTGIGDCLRGGTKTGLFKSQVPSMDEGWTRWLFDDTCIEDETISAEEIRNNELNQKKPPFGAMATRLITEGKLDPKYKTIIFPDQSPNSILNGYAKGSMPDEYTGGVGKEGVENLRKFVEAGGTLVFLNRASDFAIEQFNLPIKDVTKGLARKDFYIPGSILRTRHKQPDRQKHAKRIHRLVRRLTRV